MSGSDAGADESQAEERDADPDGDADVDPDCLPEDVEADIFPADPDYEFETEALDLDPIDTWRPSLVRLTKDVERLMSAFIQGFDRPSHVLWWAQQFIVNSLGMVNDDFYDLLAREFKSADTGDATGGFVRRPTMDLLLKPHARRYDIDDADARQVRERFAAVWFVPGYHRAFRHLRKDATEAVDDAGEGDRHDPLRQRYIAMRPSLNELDGWQRQALEQCVTGLEEPATILEWGEWVELATHGEISDSFIPRCYGEAGVKALLTSTDEHAVRARLTFAAVNLLPPMNAGARTLSGRSKELPDEEDRERRKHYA